MSTLGSMVTEGVTGPTGGFAELRGRVASWDADAKLVRLRELEARQRELDAERSLVLAEIERERLHERDAHATIWGLLRATLGWSDGECRTRMRLARLVDAHPDVGECLAETWVPVAHADAIARAFANPRCGEQIETVLGTFLTYARELEYDDFRKVVDRWVILADVDGAHREREGIHERRNAHLSVWQGEGTLVAQWGDLDAAANLEIFERFCDAEFAADWESTKDRHGDDACPALMPRTDAQRRADALTAIFTRAASMPPGSKAPKPVAHIHVDYRTWRDLLTEAELLPERARDPFDDPELLVTQLRCETRGGQLVDPRHVLRATLEGYVRFVILDDEGVPIHWGRERRLFTGPARDAVMVLSDRCLHPGCRVRTGRSQADHLKPWSQGGETRPDNGGPQCARHNRVRNRGYTVHRDGRGIWHTYRPDGTEIC
jgi:hypothetical protein